MTFSLHLCAIKLLRILIHITGFVLFLGAVTFWGCHPTLKKAARHPGEALTRVDFFYPTFHDDMDFDSLISAITKNIEYLKRLPPERSFYYGPDTFTCKEVLESQVAFRRLLEEEPDISRLNRIIKENYLVYRAAGRAGNNKVLFTGYFEPVYEASRTPDETFRYPVYRKPEDLTRIDLSLFGERFEGQRLMARIAGDRVLPYYSRYQIDHDRVLDGRNLEIAWLKDPVDVAFLHIQGSGRLKLPDGSTLSVGYASSNGHPYRSIGRYMIEKGLMSREEMSMQAIRHYLHDHPQQRGTILNHNPSYIFFRILENGPLGNIAVPLTPGRSIALDATLFPKGALAFISSVKPILNEKGKITRWEPFSRLVINQDTGGAIKGAGRADLFWGNGPHAEMAAGHLKHEGELFILIKKPR
ncbi:MAG: murein transglycosylase A [Thermodesulfobacteriota bacterium]